MLRWAAKIITSKSSSCYHIDTNVTSPTPSHPPFTLSYWLLLFPFTTPVSPKVFQRLGTFARSRTSGYTHQLHHQRDPHNGGGFYHGIRWSNDHVFQDTGAKSMACIWACPVIQAPICMAASTGNLSDPKKWWQKCGDPNFAAERFSFEERELVDQELMQWVNQSKSNVSLNESLGSQEKPAWIKNESKKHVPYQYVPYERAECAPK